MRVDAVDDVVAVGAVLDHEVLGLVAVEAVPHVAELRADDPAGGFRAAHALGHVRRVLRDAHAVRLGLGVAEAGHFRIDDVGLGAAPRQQERAEFLGRAEGRRAVVLFSPAGHLGVGDEQLAVVDQERTAFLGQAQLLDLAVDLEDALLPDHDRQARQVHTRLDFAEVLLGYLLAQLDQVDMAVIDEDRLRNAMLALDPLGRLVVAADEFLEGILLEHAAQADLALVAAVDFLLHRLGGVAGQVGQLRRVHVQRLDRCAGDRVGLGLLQLLGDHLGLCGSHQAAGQQQGAGQQAVT
ncbi:hypothetical protein D3C79_546640 [compost metagenome]